MASAWPIARVITWLLWATFIGYCIYFISNRAPHLTSFGHLKPHVEAIMFGLPIAAVIMGFVQLMAKERIQGAMETPKR